MTQRSDYAGRVTGGINYIVDLHTFITRQLHRSLLLYPRVFWSQDNNSIIWMGTKGEEGGYSLCLLLTDVSTGSATDFSAALGLNAGEFLFVNNALWLPRP
jgi:succinylglutamate desuccinylase